MSAPPTSADSAAAAALPPLSDPRAPRRIPGAPDAPTRRTAEEEEGLRASEAIDRILSRLSRSDSVTARRNWKQS